MAQTGASSARPGAREGCAVVARQLVKRYQEVVALDGVDLCVPEGSIYAVVGPNGAGKTTLLSILTTLVLPTQGRAEVFGLDVVRDASRVRQILGVAFQEISLDEDLPGQAVLEFHARLRGIPPAERRARIAQLSLAVGLSSALGRRVGAYSGGMKRRLELARALIARPRLLVLDEPTTGLDPQSREAMWDMIRGLRQQEGLTVLMTTHYLEEAERLAERVAIVDRGRVVEEGTPSQLLAELGEEVVSVRGQGSLQELGSTLQGKGLVRWWRCDGTLRVGVQDAAAALAEVVDTARERGVSLSAIEVSRPSLRDVFLRVTGREPRD